MLRDGTVSVTAAAQGAHPGLALAWAAAGGAVAAPAHSTVTPLEPSVFARTSAATGTGTVTVTRTFTVDPAAAACTAAAQVGTAAVAVGTPAGARTLSAGVASGTAVDVTVTCTHPGRSDAAAAVRLTARAADACEDFIGVLPAGLTARAGTIAADAGCVSAQRRENLNGRVYYARRHTFTLDAAATVTATHASAATAPRLGDPYLLLLAGHGTSGEVIDTDDDSGPGRAAQITAILDPGSYTLEATAFGTRRTGSYTLAVDSTAVAGCTTALGTLTAGQTTRSGGIERDSDCPSQQRIRSSRTPNYAHWHTFTLTQPAWIDIDLARPTGSGLDPYVILSRGHTRTGTVIGQDDDTGPRLDARLRDIHLPPGDYTIETTSHSANDTGTYTLTATIPISGLPDTIDATVDEQTTINFTYWPTNAQLDVQSEELALATAARDGTFTMLLAPDRVRSHTVSVHMGTAAASRSGAAGAARGATARSTQRSAVPRTYAATVNIYCGRSKILSPVNGVLCVTPSSDPDTRLERIAHDPEFTDETETVYQQYDGPYEVTLGALLGARDAVQAAVDGHATPCRNGRLMGVHELTALMLAIGFWEYPNPRTMLIDDVPERNANMRFPARSLMTLSRKDHLWTDVKSPKNNAYLYSFGSITADPARAFWHPGVGMWQLDTLSNAAHLNHGQRADTRFGGVTVAEELLAQSCMLTHSDQVVQGVGSFEHWLEGKWIACKPSENRLTKKSQCLKTKGNIWMNRGTRDDLFVTIRKGAHHISRTGGAELFECRWRTADGTEAIDHGFDPEDPEIYGYRDLDGMCYFYDTEHSEGIVNSGLSNGHRVQQLNVKGKDISLSPFAAPFVSFTDNEVRFAVFPASLLDGFSSTPIKSVPVGTSVRLYAGTAQDPSWHTDDYKGKDLRLKLCRPIAPFEPARCAWVSVKADASTPGGSFASWIAAARG